MAIRTGDVLFNQSGIPALVKERNPETGALTMDTDRKEVRRVHTTGYVNGMGPEIRQQFADVLQAVKDIPDPTERLEALSARIDELDKDPRNFALVKYLTAEKVHIMNITGIQPRYYTIPVEKILK
jgi:hypothetical protein